jgi:hypothetical protein
MLCRKKYYHLNKIGKIIEQYDEHFRNMLLHVREKRQAKERKVTKVTRMYMTTPFHGRYPLNKTLR